VEACPCRQAVRAARKLRPPTKRRYCIFSRARAAHPHRPERRFSAPSDPPRGARFLSPARSAHPAQVVLPDLYIYVRPRARAYPALFHVKRPARRQNPARTANMPVRPSRSATHREASSPRRTPALSSASAQHFSASAGKLFSLLRRSEERRVGNGCRPWLWSSEKANQLGAVSPNE